MKLGKAVGETVMMATQISDWIVASNGLMGQVRLCLSPANAEALAWKSTKLWDEVKVS
jgi:hypothetical protein